MAAAEGHTIIVELLVRVSAFVLTTETLLHLQYIGHYLLNFFLKNIDVHMICIVHEHKFLK